MQGVDLTWAGGENSFALSIELMRALQQRCDAGPPVILERLANSAWFVDDVIMPIQLGLEGGGLSKDVARKLVKTYVESQPLTYSVLCARAIMMHALYGNEEDTPNLGESEGQETPLNPSLEANGDSQTSTDGDQF